MGLSGFTGMDLRFSACVRTLAEESAEVWLERVRSGQDPPGMLAWMPLMIGGGEIDLIREWRSLVSREPNKERRSDIGGLARVFAELTGIRDRWERELEGWNVETSQVVKEWQDQAFARGRNEGHNEGFVAGRAEGRAEGELVGRRQTIRNYIRETIQTRFSATLSSDVQGIVDAQEDVARLDAWFMLALRAVSIEEFAQAIRTS